MCVCACLRLNRTFAKCQLNLGLSLVLIRRMKLMQLGCQNPEWLPLRGFLSTARKSATCQTDFADTLGQFIRWSSIIFIYIIYILYIYDTQAWRYQDSWWIDQGPAVRWWVTFRNLLLGWDGPGPYTIRVSSQCTWIGRLSDQPCSIRISIIYIYAYMCVHMCIII